MPGPRSSLNQRDPSVLPIQSVIRYRRFVGTASHVRLMLREGVEEWHCQRIVV